MNKAFKVTDLHLFYCQKLIFIEVNLNAERKGKAFFFWHCRLTKFPRTSLIGFYSPFFFLLLFKPRMNSTNTFLIFSHADIKRGGKEAEERRAAWMDGWMEDVINIQL